MSSAQIYKSAPISEVVFGITYAQPVLTLAQILKVYSESLIRVYNSAEIAPLLTTDVLNDGRVVPEPLMQEFGQAVYRFRSGEPEPNWLVQLQGNKIYFHWVRDDDKPVGHYPGFTTIFNRFVSLLNDIERLTTANVTQSDAIRQCELLYQDRFPSQRTAYSPYDASIVFTSPLPQFLDRQRAYLKSFISQSISEYTSINGYGVSTYGVEPLLNSNDVEMFHISHTLRGEIRGTSLQFDSFALWFEEAHNIQLALFNNSFSPAKFEEWKS
jgi:uncharacterized protein (TIGR04255 family)